MWLTRCGACALAYSSWKITCCTRIRSRPYGAGQPSPIQPCSPSSRSHARRVSKPSCSRPGPPASPRIGELASQVRREPVLHLGAKRLVLGREPQIHALTVLCSDVQISQTTITANGLTFGALTCGDTGPLALCLHGFPDSAHTWDHLLPELAGAGFRAVAPWTRGYAPTSVPADGDYSMTALTADANALHEALGGDADAVLVGHDWGASPRTPPALPSRNAGGASWPSPCRRRRSPCRRSSGTRSSSAASTSSCSRPRSPSWSPARTTCASSRTCGATGLRRTTPAPTLEHAKAALRDPANLAAAIGYYRAMFTTGGPTGTPSNRRSTCMARRRRVRRRGRRRHARAPARGLPGGDHRGHRPLPAPRSAGRGQPPDPRLVLSCQRSAISSVVRTVASSDSVLSMTASAYDAGTPATASRASTTW